MAAYWFFPRYLLLDLKVRSVLGLVSVFGAAEVGLGTDHQDEVGLFDLPVHPAAGQISPDPDFHR
jgi:hypothetical protein